MFEKFGKGPDAYFLFSDGLDSSSSITSTKTKHPIVALSSSSEADSDLLEHIASASCGVHVNLLTQSTNHVIGTIENVRSNINISELNGCVDVFTSLNRDRISILGKLAGNSVHVILDNQERVFKDIKIDTQNSSESNCIARFWAGRKAKEIEILKSNKDLILELGRKYGIVTSDTSLIVLETVDQYIEHQIEPPDSLPEFQKLFRSQQQHVQIKKKAEFKSHLERIISLWKKRTEWWEEEYKSEYLEKKRREEIKKSLIRPESVIHRNMRRGAGTTQDESLSFIQAPDEALEENNSPEVFYSLAGSSQSDEVCEDFEPEVNIQENVAKVSIKPWDPSTPYLDQIKSVAKHKQYSEYLNQSKLYTDSPSFYLDCGNYFLQQAELSLGFRILSNLEELRLDDVALLRIYAWRLLQAGIFNTAIEVLERIKSFREDEPQSHRDLALALSERWEMHNDPTDAIRAIDLFYDVVCREWDRFEEIELIALMELNRLVALARDKNITIPSRIDSRLLKHLDLDIRISLSWDADLTDVDLHVFEPNGGHAYYSNNLTQIGGLVSKDFTQGYGPEEYILRHAMPGKYLIKAHYYGSHQQALCGPCTVTSTVFTNFGRDSEKKQMMTLRLDKASDQELIGELLIDGPDWTDDIRNDVIMIHEHRELDDFKAITKGMSISKVKSLVGTPDDIEGEQAILFVYHLGSKEKIHLIFSPILESATHITDTVESVFIGRTPVKPSNNNNEDSIYSNNEIAVSCIRVCNLLRRAGYITEHQFSEVEREYNVTGVRANQIVLAREFIEVDTLANFISRNFDYELIDIQDSNVDPTAVQIVEYGIAKKFLTLPISLTGDHLHVTMVDPTDDNIVQSLAQVTGKNIIASVSHEHEIIEAYRVYYGISDEEYSSFY